MKYNNDARLDTSEVSDTRGSGRSIGGRGAAAGGGLGVVGVVIYLVVTLIGGGGAGNTAASVLDTLGTGGSSGQADNQEIEKSCRTGADANNKLECAIVADINSIQAYWSAALGTRYTEVNTVWFSGQVTTGCGAADSGSGPFYCPRDQRVYIDLSFYDQLKQDFGATGGPFVNAYVLAHEYGHHVQDLLGTEAKVRTRSGPTSDSVRLELQADCYAGVWAKHATEPAADGGPALISEITQQDFNNALDAAGRIGDDYIQKNLGSGQVDRSSFTHGSSAQREKWFTTGYRTGVPQRCDTFAANDLG
ncbi:MAG: neutral zinc metallopeptidase [Jatrophihabitans sp.]